jgi:drug/metabolite transporter (DMT)-like permease
MVKGILNFRDLCMLTTSFHFPNFIFRFAMAVRMYSSLDLGILCAFLGLDITKSIVLSWSNANKHPYERPSDFNIIYLKDILSFLIATIVGLLTLKVSVWRLFGMSFTLVFQHLPSAFMVVLSQNAAFSALQILDIGTFKLLLQGCTPLTVMFSVFFLNQRFAKRQYYAIVANCLFSMLFYAMKNKGIPDSDTDIFSRGIGFSLLVTVLSSLGGVVSEGILKSRTSSMTLQVFASRLALVIASTALYLPMHSPFDHSGSFLDHFDWRTSVVIFQYTASSFLTTVLITRLSTSAKAITQAASAAFSQMVTMVSGGWMHQSVQKVAATNTDPFVTACAFGIIASVYIFHRQSEESKPDEPYSSKV